MPILDLQRSLRRLGRIRMGRQVETANGKMRPDKLAQWRMTSASRDLLEAAASLYGGEVHDWEGAPAGAKQYELFTESDSLDITIPPGEMAFSQWYELWSGGGCQRRCDGSTDQLSGEACLCPLDAEERHELANKGKACKPTTRLFVILHRVPDIGMWHLETHGYYAAVELAGSIDVLRMANAAGLMPSANLRIEQRTTKRDGKTNNFAVPVIELPTLSAGTLMSGEAPARAIDAPRPALEAPRAEPPAAPAPTAADASDAGAEAPGARSGTRRPASAPPLPADAKEAGSPKYVADLHRYAAEVAKKHKLDANLLLEAVVHNMTNGRTRTTKELEGAREAGRVNAGLREVENGQTLVVPDADEDDQVVYRIELATKEGAA